MKKIINKIIYISLMILFFLILLENSVFANYRPMDIIAFHLEWCIYLLIPSILLFIISLILKLKNKTKNKKIVSILLTVSIIYLIIVGILFTIYNISFYDIKQFMRYFLWKIFKI